MRMLSEGGYESTSSGGSDYSSGSYEGSSDSYESSSDSYEGDYDSDYSSEADDSGYDSDDTSDSYDEESFDESDRESDSREIKTVNYETKEWTLRSSSGRAERSSSESSDFSEDGSDSSDDSEEYGEPAAEYPDEPEEEYGEDGKSSDVGPRKESEWQEDPQAQEEQEEVEEQEQFEQQEELEKQEEERREKEQDGNKEKEDQRPVSEKKERRPDAGSEENDQKKAEDETSEADEKETSRERTDKSDDSEAAEDSRDPSGEEKKEWYRGSKEKENDPKKTEKNDAAADADEEKKEPAAAEKAADFAREKGFGKAADYIGRHYDGDEEFSPDRPIPITTRNMKLEGQEHETGVSFTRREIELTEGLKVEGVFPEFDSSHHVELGEEANEMSLHRHFTLCKEDFQDHMYDDPEKLAGLTLGDMMKMEEPHGYAPEGKTWQHNPETGSFDMVDTEEHESVAHTGGNALWGRYEQSEVTTTDKEGEPASAEKESSGTDGYSKDKYEKTTFVAEDKGERIERTVYINHDIDPELVIPAGTSLGGGHVLENDTTNLELMSDGKPPFVYSKSESGEEQLVRIELHHTTGRETIHSASFFGSENTRGGMIELAADLHDEHNAVLHIPKEDGTSFRVDTLTGGRSEDAKRYDRFRGLYWKARAESFKSKK